LWRQDSRNDKRLLCLMAQPGKRCQYYHTQWGVLKRGY